MSNNVAAVAKTENEKKYYGGTITVAGRNLITSLVAGETIEFTRIVVGTGSMPEDIEPIDMKELVNPVAEGTSTIPTVENCALYMTVEYRNDMNGGLKAGFWLREFGIFAKTENSEEILLYYATLGDSPQPVNAYLDNRIDIRRYPITIALEVDADIQVTYNPGAFVTADEAQALVSSMVSEAVSGVGSAIIADITIPSAGWMANGQGSTDGYGHFIEVAVEGAIEKQFPSVVLHKPSLDTAAKAGLCPTVQTIDGALRFWSRSEPVKDMAATVALLTHGTGGGTSSGGGDAYALPAATTTRLGGVRIGDGIDVTEDGTISADGASLPKDAIASDGEAAEMLDEVFAQTRSNTK